MALDNHLNFFTSASFLRHFLNQKASYLTPLNTITGPVLENFDQRGHIFTTTQHCTLVFLTNEC